MLWTQAEEHDSRRDALTHCVEKIPLHQREVLTAHYVLGHSVAEIAQARGMGLSAVKVLLLRLRRLLAGCIERRLVTEAQS